MMMSDAIGKGNRNMAAKSRKSESSGTVKSGFDDYTFINFSLTEQQKKEASAWVEKLTAEATLDMLDDLTQSGMKFSLSMGTNGVAFATATDKAYSTQFNKRILSVRAGTPAKALSRLLWLHSIHAGGDWSLLQEQTSEDW